jgi:diaminopimelate epimerase
MLIQNTTYTACGNRVLIHHLHSPQDLEDLRTNRSSLLKVAKLAIKNKADSVMVVTGDPNNQILTGYNVTMDVFEPHAFFLDRNDQAWSTMCGNGVRAVAQYLQDYYQLNTECVIRSGMGDQLAYRSPIGWKIHMGNFYNLEADLRFYVNTLPSTQDIKSLVDSQAIDSHPYIGFNAQKNVDTLDGEPHLVLFHNSAKTLLEVKAQAEMIGPILTTYSEWFPLEINTNIAAIQKVDTLHRRIDVLLATYERNIYYVTQACGTGSTAVAASILRRLKLAGNWRIHVHNLGGELIVETDAEGTYWLTGPAEEL